MSSGSDGLPVKGRKHMRRFAILAAPLAASVAAVAMQLPTTMASATSSDCAAKASAVVG